MLTNLLDGLNSFGAAILENMGRDKDEAQRMVTEVSQQYKECTKWRMSMNMFGPLLVPFNRRLFFGLSPFFSIVTFLRCLLLLLFDFLVSSF